MGLDPVIGFMVFMIVQILKGEHCTVDILFDWLGLVCLANKNKDWQVHTADSKPVKKGAQ
jgi:hypothetical protein